MIIWSAHLVPEKNAINLYRRTKDLTQIRHPEPTNRRVLTYDFKNIHRDEIFEAAAKVLEEKGYSTINKWKRDTNFDIWYAFVAEKTDDDDVSDETMINILESSEETII